MKENYQLQITIVRSLGYAIGLLKGLNAPEGTVGELEENLDYIIEEFVK